MGQANRRGTFEERKAKAITRSKIKYRTDLEELEKEKAARSAGMTPEQKSAKLKSKIDMLSFMVTANRLGFSPKEMKRRVMRFKKKGN